MRRRLMLSHLGIVSRSTSLLLTKLRRLEQNFCNMVDKIVTKQRLGYCKSQVRNQETMEARDGAI